ncbi:flagellar assembly protein FliW [Thermodesulfobacteriota bacterium]
MKITTSRFGELDIDKSREINFAEGILGFAKYHAYVLLDHDAHKPFKWLQSIENGELAFVVTDPLTVIPDYTAAVSKQDVDAIQLDSLEKAVVLCIVTIGKGCSSVTANLVAPIIINPDAMLAKQVILYDSPYSIKHDLIRLPKKANAE